MLLSHSRRVKRSQSLLPRQPQLRVLQAGTLALHPDQPTRALTQTHTHTHPHMGTLSLKYMLPHISTLSSYVNTQKRSYLFQTSTYALMHILWSDRYPQPTHPYGCGHTRTHSSCECPCTLTHALTPGPALTLTPDPLTGWGGLVGARAERKWLVRGTSSVDPTWNSWLNMGQAPPTALQGWLGGKRLWVRGQQCRDRTVGTTEPLPGPANGSVVPTQGWPSLGVGSW